MNRVTIFAHFDANDEVKPFIEYYLERLLTISSRIVFVSTAKLPPTELVKLRRFADPVLLRDNEGFDFSMWREALGHVQMEECDEVLLTNSSVYGPVYPLGPIVDRMSERPCDFWGMNDSLEHRWHLQSYFMVFKRRILASNAFSDFWRSVLPFRDKAQVIASYELGLSAFFVEQGFSGESFVPSGTWAGSRLGLLADRQRRRNPSSCSPLRLLELGMPFVKVSVLRDNACRVPLAPLLHAMRDAGYPLEQLGVDSRRSRASQLLSRIRA